ncbi:hypothetical protein [Klebsiella sp. CVUAS 10975.2]|uniref:hypothetical protein n=1 Tax=Klebsiella sp. CVUAS 10975.2 TaxID=2109904 RepID=UPI001C823743|nr:hypothetical protein [Klebsiella sp. CVUAS 10975.2]
MTTDITELAQREKFEAWWEREYKHLESSKYTDAVPHIKYGFWMAYQAGGAELVEALEKAQAGEKQWREVVDAFCADDADWHKLTNSNNELIALLSQALCKQADRIAELESRTVKLPRPGFITISGERMAVYLKGDVDAAMLAAGIEEAE